MSCQSDSAAACGCCEGPRILTPREVANRPGLSALSVRIGTHGSFLETMLARLASQDFPVLRELTTRNRDDAAIALLDAGATVLDVLTFYTERVANEGYLRTATERRSVLELARLVGYRPRPGVAASVFLAFTLDPGAELEIPPGQPARSIPAPGTTDLPQTFETSHPLKARAELNRIRPRMSLPQEITPENVLNLETIWLAGTALNLKPNDLLLVTFTEEPDINALRRVESAEPDFENQRTRVILQLVTLSARRFVRDMRGAVRGVRDRAAFAFESTDVLRNEVRDLSSLVSPLLGELTFDKSLADLDATMRDKLSTNIGPLTSQTYSDLVTLVSQVAAGFTEVNATADAALAEAAKMRANMKATLQDYVADDNLVTKVLNIPALLPTASLADLGRDLGAQIEKVTSLVDQLHSKELIARFQQLATGWTTARQQPKPKLLTDYDLARASFNQSIAPSITSQLFDLIDGIAKLPEETPLRAVTDRLFETGPIDGKPTLRSLETATSALAAAPNFHLRLTELLGVLGRHFSDCVTGLKGEATLPPSSGDVEPVLTSQRSVVTSALTAFALLSGAASALPDEGAALSTQIEAIRRAREDAAALSDQFNLLDLATAKVFEVLSATRSEFVNRVKEYPPGTRVTLLDAGPPRGLGREMSELLDGLDEAITPTRAEDSSSDLTGRKLRDLAALLDAPIRTLTEKTKAAPTSLVSAMRRIVGHLRNLRFQVKNKPETADTVAAGEVSAGQGGLTDLLQDFRSIKAARTGSPLSITRDLGALFAADGQKASDPVARIAARLGTGSAGDLFAAWKRIRRGVGDVSIYAFREKAAVFGHNAGIGFAIGDDPDNINLNARFESPEGEIDWAPLDDPEPDTDLGNRLFLDREYPGALPGGYVVIHRPDAGPEAFGIRAVMSAPRTVYGLSAKSTALDLEGGAKWGQRLPHQSPRRPFPVSRFDLIRKTVVYVQSERMLLSEQPIVRPVGLAEVSVAGEGPTPVAEPDEGVSANPLTENAATFTLDALYEGIEPGRWIIVAGERFEGVTGAIFKEVALVQNVDHVLLPALREATLPLGGDAPHTRIVLSKPLDFSYKRETVEIFGNVIDATHGERREEVLGNGDARLPFQTFELKQPPITYTAAPTIAGAESTLQVRVNDVRWHEVESFEGLEPGDRRFITETGDDGNTRVVFGNGREGARLPTGSENVKALYRNGLGKAGNVKAGAISQLTTKPLGLKEVINPLRAAGGADRETRDQIRRNAPLAAMALQRLVSVQDYEDFAQTFAGIGKASAVRLSDATGSFVHVFVHVTVAGLDDIPIDDESELFKNFAKTLSEVGDPRVRVEAAARELVLLVLVANVKVQVDHLWEKVEAKLRAALLDAFGFERRALGQDVFLSEVLSVMQAVEGVDYVDVDRFGGIPEKRVEPPGPAAPRKRVPLSPVEIAARIGDIAEAKPKQTISADLAALETPGDLTTLHPAQLAIFSPEITETIVLQERTTP